MVDLDQRNAEIWLREQLVVFVPAVYAVRNDFFGPLINVAGLVTGGDLIRQLKGRPLYDELLIPSSMLRREGDLFLDDCSLQEVEDALGVKVTPVGGEAESLLRALTGDRG